MRKKAGTSTYIQRINTLEKSFKRSKRIRWCYGKTSRNNVYVKFALKHCSKTYSRSFWCIKIYHIQMD